MKEAKRHHWWPMTQSQLWTAADGLVYVARSDGRTFRANPLNIGVESELYTRFGEQDRKDTSIEKWFGEAIDGPANAMINHLLDAGNVVRRPFQGNPVKVETVRTLGFRVRAYVDEVLIPPDVRQAISQYLAALLVRHPSYLAKLTDFHSLDSSSSTDARNRALDNMLHLYGVYSEAIAGSVFILTRRGGSAEYLYADGGIVAEEPWRTTHGIPFDIHAPLTPDIAIQILPMPIHGPNDLGRAALVEVTNQGISRQNRIVLGSAVRFVFSRQAPPIQFISRYFGRPAPRNIGYRVVNGRLETKYDPTRK
jgi:hypothetical protein